MWSKTGNIPFKIAMLRLDDVGRMTRTWREGRWELTMGCKVLGFEYKHNDGTSDYHDNMTSFFMCLLYIKCASK